ncbi:conserved hypothetical protein [Leishmania infantum JPCM5]|uniref:REH2 DRSM domain-containing protein n=2 Tax=Leishmania infantum TaxID=5671 RepID=A4HX18_LEIIN|nr:conserved hypothetical protein [Leishmania infantum JPCM5]CAC9475937.1 hypothetical_protein_-_conserved [Leishmania infantum]CAM67005.1 conserved hypothetical protein [Leishmania infantum JPCM5]SUZ40706.1 hypothetical_protein_-_conserved [Leishmania infantum]|eukprot:XP_001464609.1 conserved hypothetical protein [Leishmania infantum JPCM5]
MQHPPVATVGAHAPLTHRMRSLWRVLPLSTKANRWAPLMESWKTALQHTRNAAVPRIRRSSNCRGFTASAGDVSSHALLASHRTCCSSASSSSSWKPPSSAGAATAAAAAEPEMISLDAIEIEVVSAEESPSTTSTTATVRHAEVHRETPFPRHRNHCAPHPHCHHNQRQREVCATDFFTAQLHATSAAGGREYDSDGASTASAAHVVSGSGEAETGVPASAVQRQDYCDAHTIDAFARGRIANFVRRMGHSTGTVFHVRAMTPAQAAAVTGSATGPTLFAATCRLPLPEPHGSRVAEGVAEDAKEAEALAAMHAERVCDALGVQLFRLRTAQQKHADAVRKEEGRYAPYPDDPIKPLGTPIPPPLRLLRSRMHASSNAPGAASARSVFSVASEVAAADAVASSQSHRYTAERGEASAATVAAPRVQRSHLARTPPAPREVPLGGQAQPAESAESGVGEDDSASASPATAGGSVAPPSAAGAAMGFDSTRIVLRRHDPVDDYAQLVFHYTDEEHAERVRTYASSVYYPWICQWEGAAVAQGDVSAAPQGGAMGSDGTAAVATLGQVFDPTENGMWSMVNDRDMRCSPTPHEALVLPIVYDGPCAEARITDYYAQHNTTLKEHLRVRSASGSTGSPQRMVEAELRLIGLTIAAKGKAQTEQMAIHLAAMHAELLLDALGHPLFPADPQRQARHAEVVAGYGRWAMNPLTGGITPPNPHDALPLPLKIQIGTDDVWLGPEARRQLGHRWSDSEHIIVAMQHLNSQTEDEVEINPPAELLEEAEQLLQEWQAHVAKSRFTHLFVLFNMDNVFQATTVLPVPRQFGIRGGLGIGKTRKMAVQVCSLHALDTLCTLGVPLCVDPERERRYLQRRAALGMVLQRTSPANEGSLMHARVPRSFSGLPPPPLPGAAEKSPGTSDGGVLRLPTYVVEGSHIRLLPHIADTLHTMQLRIPEDYCLFGGASEEVLVEIGNQVRMAVQNYLQESLGGLLRSRNMQQRIQSKSGASRAVQCAAAEAGAGDAVLVTTGSGQRNETPPATGADVRSGSGGDVDTASRPAAAVVEDNIAETQAWATQFAMNLLPHNIIRGYGRQNSLHNTSFLQVPIPSSAVLPPPEMSHKIDASAVSLPPHPLMGPVYAIAIGTSLKRKDAERACYLHAASILHSFGVDVLVQYPRGQPRVRHACSFADVAKYLSKEPLIITPPFLSDGTLRASAVEAAGVKPPRSASKETASALSTSSAPQPGSLHPPRPVMHTNMKAFLESTRGITLPRKRKARLTSPS